MFNAIPTHQQELIPHILQLGQLFGGAVRDMFTGEFYSEDWKGDFDVTPYSYADFQPALNNLLANSVRNRLAFKIVDVLEEHPTLCKMLISYKDKQFKLDLVANPEMNYDGTIDDPLIDIDVNGLMYNRTGMFVRGDCNVPFTTILEHIRAGEFMILKELSDTRRAKVIKLLHSGWKCLNPHLLA